MSIDLSLRWQVIEGDCLDVMRALPDGCVDAVVTDPPYGIAHAWKGGSGHGWGGTDTEKAVRNEWDDSAPDAAVWPLLLGLSKKVVVWGGNYFPLPPSRCWFVWNKPERGFTLAEAELAWTSIDAVVRCWDGSRHIWNREHPTQKPLALMEWCIGRLNLAPDSLIIDPYCGSGTTGVAAVNLGYRFLGIEREPSYCTIARRRIADAAAQGNLFGGPQ